MRGLIVPSFYKNMTFKEKVSELLNAGLEEKPSIFLIDLSITDAFKIIVTLDGDNGVTLQDCIDISRAIEHNLDREEQDFSLEVASGGVSAPLKLVRQYKKNIGRTLQVKTATEIITAELVDANDEFITLTWTAREPKKIGKGKETVEKRQELPYTDIKEAIVTITF
ncbi:ribosome maturation factor RimP [Flavobacterium endophyticum]|uniref:Ribosome maturation factor RimP n=2 Tax=Flavobacterium endophyticum TaxID=1540163 RepID=A0A495MIY7_9FLAO|nr:ribosome maturation factor RimP [Flavobacterium endophyticum]